LIAKGIHGLFSGILILSLLFQAGSRTMMNLWFSLDNASFEEQFCVNKDEPEKGCHGSCMMKKINQAPDEKDDITPFTLNIQLRLSDFIPAYGPPLVLNASVTLFRNSFCYFFKYFFSFSFDVFHPPKPLALLNVGQWII
jgi:hypothetical protein